jgi:hypothetical protein
MSASLHSAATTAAINPSPSPSRCGPRRTMSSRVCVPARRKSSMNWFTPCWNSSNDEVGSASSSRTVIEHLLQQQPHAYALQGLDDRLAIERTHATRSTPTAQCAPESEPQARRRRARRRNVFRSLHLRPRLRWTSWRRRTRPPEPPPPLEASLDKLAEEEGSRTLRRPYGRPRGFEDRGGHRAPSSSVPSEHATSSPAKAQSKPPRPSRPHARGVRA